MTADLYARMAPHLTVLSDDDPDMSTRDPIVARALSDAAGAADAGAAEPRTGDAVLRISVTALGHQSARYSLVVVASADFHNASPRVNVLLRQRVNTVTNRLIASDSTHGIRSPTAME